MKAAEEIMRNNGCYFSGNTQLIRTISKSMEEYANQFKQQSVHGIWITPTSKPDNAEELHWRCKSAKTKVHTSAINHEGIYDDWNELVFNWEEIEYLHEGHISTELAKQIAGQKFPFVEVENRFERYYEAQNRIVRYKREAYALALTEIIKL